MLDRTLRFKNKFHCTSLGCSRNLVDSEVMIGILLKAGYEYTAQPEEADYLLVNTCGFLEASRQEGIEVIEELFRLKKEEAKVIVSGCMVQKHGALLKEKFPKIHYFLGSGDLEQIVNAVQQDFAGEAITDAKGYLEWGEIPRTLSTPKHYAYLKIAEGCRKRCAFCIIPAIKGPLRSKTSEQVMREFQALLAQGVFEVILIAQDLGDFGKDRKEKGALAKMLREMLKIEKDFWIRLLYLYPDEIDEELIQVMKSDRRICPYLDMPIQHISDVLLKSMHRMTSKRQILETLHRLRYEIPEISIRTSLIVGFPGETEEHFGELIQFVQKVPLDHVGVFQFSLEKEAYAAQLPSQVPELVKKERFMRLMAVQLKEVRKRNRKKIGQVVHGIVEGFHPDSKLLLRARHQGQCPEIDGQIIINDSRHVKAFGCLYDIEITEIADHDFIGRVLPSNTTTKKPSCKLSIVSN